MKKLILSLCILGSLTTASPLLAQQPAAPAAPTVNVERHVDVQQITPNTNLGIDQQTMMWVGGLVGIGILLGLVAMMSRGTNESVTVVRDY